VSLRVLTNPELQVRVMRGGVRRLLLLSVSPSRGNLTRALSNADRLAIARCRRFTLDQLVDDCITAAADQVMAEHGALPWDVEAFAALRSAARDHVATRASTALRTAVAICAATVVVQARLDRLVVPVVQPAVADTRAQLDRLVRPSFVTAAGAQRLTDILRYVQGIDRRLEKLPSDPMRDQQRMREVGVLEQRYASMLKRLDRDAITAEVIDLGWMLEELRVGLFAQALGTARPVSVKRVDAALRALGG